MQLPAAFFLRLLPFDSCLAASIALTAVYGINSPYSYGLFGLWAYAPYLSSALGAGGKFLGFLLRSIFLSNHDMNVWAAATVFLTAGMSACTSAQAAVLSDWFAHSGAAQRLALHRRHPRIIPAMCRLVSIPVLIFGPGIGVPAAVLMYGVKTVDSAHHAMTIRKWSAWGTLACLIVLTLFALLALVLAVLRCREAGAGASRAPELLAATTLASVVLIEVSGAARVRALYQPSVSLDDRLWYPLVALPELLQQLLACWPALLHRAGLADSYKGWRTATWPWVRRRFPPSADGALAAEAGAGEATKAGPQAASSVASIAVSTASGKSDKEAIRSGAAVVTCMAA
ncbi:hypothetical protein ABPG75_007391 [Micractinium tetrahymenae]